MIRVRNRNERVEATLVKKCTMITLSGLMRFSCIGVLNDHALAACSGISLVVRFKAHGIDVLCAYMFFSSGCKAPSFQENTMLVIRFVFLE